MEQPIENVQNTQSKSLESFEFEAEVPQVMSLIINSVYSSKEMFLRELISNASDAISKIKSKKNELDEKGYKTVPFGDYKIKIMQDKANNTLTVSDNGIGMSKSDSIAFLGSIASSGTKKFREFLNTKNRKADMDALIGQFGLGFYSAFLVAKRVDVITKNPMDEAYIWSSEGGSSYTIGQYDAGDMLHGTSVILTLKEGEQEYLETAKIIEIIKKHSLYVKYPISVFVEKEVVIKEDEEVKEINEGDEPVVVSEEPKKVQKVVEEQVVNCEIPVWTKKIEELSDEELKKFYRMLSNDYDDYLAVQSWHFDGVINMKILLFIPKKAKLNFFEQTVQEKNKNIKVFNSNVFITDELGKDVVPDSMNFVVGAVSSTDFPMNISREFLQGKGVMNVLKTKISKCVAEMINKLDAEKFEQFYKEFSSNIKAAVRHFTDNQQETYAKFLRYPTNQDPSTPISLDEYLSKVGKDQKQILYLTGMNKKEVETSLLLEGFKDRLVLLMSEPIDEVMLQGLKAYRGLSLQNISIEGVDSVNPVDETVKAEYAAFLEAVKETLKDKIDRAEISTRFSSVPASIRTSKYGHSSTMENMLKAQPGAENNPLVMMMLKSKKIFELNVDSPVVKQLKSLFDKDEDGKTQAMKYIEFLFNAALVGSGFLLDEKNEFVKDVYRILSEAITKE